MELLAPVGSISALKAAIGAGADALYLGLSEHNARIKANDFNVSNLKEWVDYAHLFGVKVHITLNTAVRDDEIDRVMFLAQTAVAAGADALIVSDLGIFSLLAKRTNIPLHLSTQAGVQNYLDARFASLLGATRVITARETLSGDLSKIVCEVPETECFIQGALCVSFSGGCLLGSLEYGSSGNRGVCNQACRLRYKALNECGELIKEGYFLSPFDLCVGSDILGLQEKGVVSAKIEGRLKRASYVYNAVKYYRAILDGKDASEFFQNMQTAFNRGFTKGYTLRKSDRIINGKVPAHIGVFIGFIEKTVDKNGYKYAYLKTDRALRAGDGAKILRNGVEVGGSDVTSVHYDDEYQVIPVSGGVKAGDEVRLTTDYLQTVFAENIVNKRKVTFTVNGIVGEKMCIQASCDGISVEVYSHFLLDRGKDPTNASIYEKLSKLGNSDFDLSAYNSEIMEPVFIPVKELNSLRRELVGKLRSELIRKNTSKFYFRDEKSSIEEVSRKKEIICEVQDDLTALSSIADSYVLNLKTFTPEKVKEFVLKAKGKPVYLRMPKIARECDVSYIIKLLEECPDAGIFADNLYAVQIARQMKRRYIAGTGLNVFNMVTESLFSDADHVMSSLEWNDGGDTIFVAGKLPLMSFAHCPVSVVYDRKCSSCKRDIDNLYYTNMDKRYLIRRNVWRDCSFTMYDDVIAKRKYDHRKSSFYSFVAISDGEKKMLLSMIKEEKGV